MSGPAKAKPHARAVRSATLRRWRRGTLLVAALSGLVFLVNVLVADVEPGNAWGLTYGTLATIAMAVVAAYGVRRRTMQRDLGRTRQWLLLHVYGGGLFLLFMLMHSGFVFPHGPLNIVLWTLSVWVSLSGAIGVLLQKWIPRLLSSGLSLEAVYERIPDLIDEMRQECENLVMTAGEPVRRLYEETMAPAMAGVAPRAIYCIDITGGVGARMREWYYVGSVLDDEEGKKLDRLSTLFRAKLELDAQYTLQRTLRWWLYTHVPASVLLLGAVLIHLYAVLYY